MQEEGVPRVGGTGPGYSPGVHYPALGTPAVPAHLGPTGVQLQLRGSREEYRLSKTSLKDSG